MASTYEKIATTTLGSDQATVTFSSISGSYTDLILISNPKSTTGSNTYLNLQFNSDTGANYSYTILKGNGSSASSTRGSNTNFIYIVYESPVPTNFNTNVITQIQNYSNTTTYKSVLNRSNNASGWTEATAGLWRNTAAITSITIDMDASGSTIATGSTFTLYGILKA